MILLGLPKSVKLEQVQLNEDYFLKNVGLKVQKQSKIEAVRTITDAEMSQSTQIGLNELWLSDFVVVSRELGGG